jgi:hypothetical protein
MFARFVYKQTFQRALDDGMKTVDEMTEILRERGIISEESDQEIKKLEGKIEGQRAEKFVYTQTWQTFFLQK